MKLRLERLRLEFKRSTEVIELPRFLYFWGKIGAGKSSIARLIDYCLGANIALTPALQRELTSATLELVVGKTTLTLYRQRETPSLIANWRQNQQDIQIVIPARNGRGSVLPGINIEVLSDLLFHLAGMVVPMVRKGKHTENERLERLSFRDLFRYCYLDQDSMDSDFFHLDLLGEWSRRQKSIDALRFVMGFHQEQVAALEAELQEIHEKRLALRAGAEAFEKVLIDAGISNPTEIDASISKLQVELEATRARATQLRTERAPTNHAVDDLRDSARKLALEIDSLEDALRAIGTRASDTERHRNELQMMAVRFQRTSATRAILAGVNFANCPRCSQALPQRDTSLCPLCGQSEEDEKHEHLQEEVVTQDLKTRLDELGETITRLNSQRERIGRALQELKTNKRRIDHELTEAMQHYDSAFLSQALEAQRSMASCEQRIESLLSIRKLPEKLNEHFAAANELQGREAELRARLNREREAAFKDRANIEKLESIFLDCLRRAAFPGVREDYVVRIDQKDFIPEVMPSPDGDFVVTSFANMGSGGMKSLFKACYALAIHRLAAQSGAPLPTVIMLDSAMKNVSERENKELFESFYRLVYELAASELSDTQFIVIDKERCPVPSDVELSVTDRHMAPGSRENRPLIPYYEMEDSD